MRQGNKNNWEAIALKVWKQAISPLTPDEDQLTGLAKALREMREIGRKEGLEQAVGIADRVEEKKWTALRDGGALIGYSVPDVARAIRAAAKEQILSETKHD